MAHFCFLDVTTTEGAPPLRSLQEWRSERMPLGAVFWIAARRPPLRRKGARVVHPLRMRCERKSTSFREFPAAILHADDNAGVLRLRAATLRLQRSAQDDRVGRVLKHVRDEGRLD
jgi:hypothetical protein